MHSTRPDDRRRALVALWPQSRSDLSRCVFAALSKICKWEAAGNPIVEFRRAETHFGLIRIGAMIKIVNMRHIIALMALVARTPTTCFQ
jgi:hypothetical protein